jgi:hypothetical protein
LQAVLTRVFDVLAAQAWFDTTRPFEYSVNFTRGACVWLLLTRGGVPDTYVKFSEHISLQTEAARYAQASRHHASLVPQFMGYSQHQGLDVMACKAVDYLGLNAARLQSDPLLRPVLMQLLPFFASAGALPFTPDTGTLPNVRLADAMQPYFDATAQAARARRWLGDGARAWVARQPDVPQHGDLMLNNLGLRPDRSLVVFDWEDLGAVCLPGLDLFTLELSLAGSVAGLLRSRRKGSSALQSFVRDACAAQALSADEYHTMTPIFALAFRYLKRNYGPGVRDRMDELLASLAQETEGI